MATKTKWWECLFDIGIDRIYIGRSCMRMKDITEYINIHK